MNEFLSEEIPFNDIPHDEFLSIKICKGLRPTISNDIPKLLADLIIKLILQIYHLFNSVQTTSYTAQSTSANPISECLDVQLSELELNEICQDDEHNIELNFFLYES
ncbi:unnamed protein product [Rhizophagus irregularis]|nr:unnamed protein product [Rhizophagus irregularis]